jgi:hypothetical protein
MARRVFLGRIVLIAGQTIHIEEVFDVVSNNRESPASSGENRNEKKE